MNKQPYIPVHIRPDTKCEPYCLESVTLFRRRDHSRKDLFQVKFLVDDDPPRPREAGAADVRRSLTRFGRARAAGTVAFVVAWSAK